jgi:predicted nucleic acid-binding protein
MSDLVVDSSVAAKWILPEADSDLADQLAIDALRQGKQLLLLDIARSEIANAIWKQCHRRLIDASATMNYLDQLLRLPLRYVNSENLFERAMSIAIQYDRSFFDALFVALVDERRCEGITAHGPLVRSVTNDFPQIILLRNWQSRPA